jgi:septum formation protein
VIGADTIVVYNDRVLEKPKDRDHALSMLEQLNGNTHTVFTGVRIIYKAKDDQVEQCHFVEKTNVQFSKLDTETMNACKLCVCVLL